MFLHDYLSDYKFITDEAVSEKREIRRVCREFGISALVRFFINLPGF